MGCHCSGFDPDLDCDEMNWVDRRRGSSAKMGNVRTELDGHSFASKLEASVYQILKFRMAAGEIKSIQCQDHVYLSKARIGYICDFKCTLPNGSFLYVEAKGYANDRWPMIKKLYKAYGPAPLEIWRGSHLKPVLDETIIPSLGDEL